MMGEAILTMSAVEPGNSSACASADGEEHQPYSLLCRVGSQLCAVPLDRVIEVMRMLPIKPVRKAPHYVRGLCIIRGAPVLVIDTGLLIGNRATDCERLITVRAGDRTIALAAETVLGIWAIGADILRRLPPLLGDAATDTIAAIGSRDAELLYVLRLARIVPDDLVDQLTVEGAQL